MPNDVTCPHAEPNGCRVLHRLLDLAVLLRQIEAEMDADVSYGGTAADDQEDRCLGGCGSRVLPEEEKK